MIRLIRAFAAASIATIALAPCAKAQTANFNLAGGLSLANGDFGNRNDAGYSLIVGIGMTQRGSPISVRAEGIYNEFDPKGFGGKAHAGGITGNAIWDFAAGSGAQFTPYAIGGIGLYSTRELSNDSQTNVGWNLGGGLRFPLTGFSAYVELRYHSISNADVALTPIVFGLRF